jgi:hypothetical protein
MGIFFSLGVFFSLDDTLTPEQAEIRSLKGQAKRHMINNTPIVIDRKTIFLLPVIMGVLLIITLSWVPC